MIAFSFFASLALALISTDTPPAVSLVKEEAAAKQPLAILYAGCDDTPRDRDFVAFLKDHFATVGVINLQALSMERAEGFDVVVAAWKGRYTYIDGKVGDALYGGNTHTSIPPEFTKPIVMVGSVAGEIVPWSKIGWL